MSLKNIKHNPYKIVQMFEEEVAEYTGAPYAVSIDNCTNALFLCCMYLTQRHKRQIYIPRNTYLSVPMAVLHSGNSVVFADINWSGCYQLRPLPVWDSAKRLTSDMYITGSFMCLSFHIKKTLSIGKGGMILTDDKQASEWFKRARYEGRGECNYKDDDIKMLGWNMYMEPKQAAHGLALMQNYPLHVPDLGEHNGYRDLTEFTVFKEALTAYENPRKSKEIS